MAATIIQFPQTHSNIFLNLTQLINLASDNQVVEEYAEIMAVSCMIITRSEIARKKLMKFGRSKNVEHTE